MPNNDPKESAIASEPEPTDDVAVTTPDGELGEEDLDAVSGGLSSPVGTILTTKPPVCVTRLP